MSERKKETFHLFQPPRADSETRIRCLIPISVSAVTAYGNTVIYGDEVMQGIAIALKARARKSHFDSTVGITLPQRADQPRPAREYVHVPCSGCSTPSVKLCRAWAL